MTVHTDKSESILFFSVSQVGVALSTLGIHVLAFLIKQTKKLLIDSQAESFFLQEVSEMVTTVHKLELLLSKGKVKLHCYRIKNKRYTKSFDFGILYKDSYQSTNTEPPKVGCPIAENQF